MIAQLFNVLLGAFTAVVRMVQDKLNPIQHHPKPCTMSGLYCCPQVVKQRLYFPPVHVCTDRFLEYCPKQGYMAAHGMMLFELGFHCRKPTKKLLSGDIAQTRPGRYSLNAYLPCPSQSAHSVSLNFQPHYADDTAYFVVGALFGFARKPIAPSTALQTHLSCQILFQAWGFLRERSINHI
jgi:hypothetical protein